MTQHAMTAAGSRATGSPAAGVRHGGPARGFSAAYLARITPKVAPAQDASGGRLAAWGRRFAHLLAGRRSEAVPELLREDVGLDNTACTRQAEFNRLDAQLHARFY